MNIVNGPYLGGNYWANPNGTGFSQTHPDRGDGFCTEPYVLDANNTDYLPLHTIAPDYTLQLYAGWNHISVPKVLLPGKDTSGIVFSGVDLAFHPIFSYDAASGWREIMDNDTLHPLDSYWIYSARAQGVSLFFDHRSPGAPVTKLLLAGWNGVGFSDVVPTSARNTLLPVKDKWSIDIPFDAQTQRYATSIVNGATDSHSDERMMEPGQGYWVFMSASGILPSIGA